MMKLPEIRGQIWIGTDPITIDDLADKVVLVDFWTYSCINCIRTLPHIKEWYEKYKKEGLIIIGIHTPEFEFEQDPKNVKEAMLRHDVTWPVVLDNDHDNWEVFGNRYWPAEYLADQKGNVAYTHFGEGSYEETESKIRELLGLKNEGGVEQVSREHSHGAACFLATGESYCGYMRGNSANDLGYAEDKEETYKESPNGKEGSVNLNGKFLVTHEYVESREIGASLSMTLQSTEVNMVLSPVAPIKKETVAEVLWNGALIPNELHGSDVSEEGKIIINRSGIYNLIKSDKLIEGVIKIKAEKENFRAYAFTFSGCVR